MLFIVAQFNATMNLSAQLDTTYTHNGLFEFSHQVFATDDGAVFFGSGTDQETDLPVILCRKIDAAGVIQIEKSYSIHESAMILTGFRGSVIQSSGGEYWWTLGAEEGNYLVKIDEDLDTLSTHLLPAPADPPGIFTADMPVEMGDELLVIGRSGDDPSQHQHFQLLDETYGEIFLHTDIIQPYHRDRAYDHDFTEGDEFILSGICGTWDEDQESTRYSPCLGRYDLDGNQTWISELGSIPMNDSEGIAELTPDGNIAFYYVGTDFLGSNFEWSNRGTLTRTNFSLDGEELDTVAYEDSIPGGKIRHVEIANEKIYVLGEKWGGYLGFYDTFILVTDLDGNQLNYKSYSHLECGDCENLLYDFDVSSDGNLYAIGKTFQDSLSIETATQDTWLLSADCMGNTETPQLIFDFQLDLEGNTGTFSLQDNPWESLEWIIDGDSYPGHEVEFDFPSSGQYELEIHGFYCGMLLDTLINLDVDLSISELSENLKLYPNPANDRVFIDGAGAELLHLQLLDMQGKIHPVTSRLDAGRIILDTSSLSDGVYIVQMVADEETMRARIIVER